jgi:hypothetical protein
LMSPCANLIRYSLIIIVDAGKNVKWGQEKSMTLPTAAEDKSDS